MNNLKDFQDVDFVVLNEDYSRFRVEDGTTIKAKVVVRKIITSIVKSPEGLPKNFGIESLDAVSAMIPPKSRKTPSKTPWDPNTDKGKDMDFEDEDVKTQSYMTDNGFKVTVKPVVTKILRYSKYNNFGEPIYKVSVQAITNIKKIKEK